MSHASARFLFRDGTVLHGEYNGTADVMCEPLFVTYEELHKHWREYVPRDQPVEPEPCVVYCDYGGGFGWHGTACRKSMVFIGPRVPGNYEADIRPAVYRESGDEQVSDFEDR